MDSTTPAATGQRFAVSHLKDSTFVADGLRPYATYRDLGFAAATGGLAHAHVVRFVGACDPAVVAVRHAHDVQFQMLYLLKGWLRMEHEGVGEQMMTAGSSWINPPNIKHTVLDYSPDCEILEITLPADYATVNV